MPLPPVLRHRHHRSWTESVGTPRSRPPTRSPPHQRAAPPSTGGDARGWASGLGWDAMLLLVALFYVYLTPYTKVEESFTMQATHDILVHGRDLSRYDHHTFPGVVPRSFLPPLALAATVAPVTTAAGLSPAATAAAVRVALAIAVVGGLSAVRRATPSRAAGAVMAVATAAQFHTLYYASRPLANTAALPLTAVALAQRLRSTDGTGGLAALAAAAAVVRCDLAALLAPAAVVDLVIAAPRGATAVVGVLAPPAVAGVAAIAASVVVDTPLWAGREGLPLGMGAEPFWKGGGGARGGAGWIYPELAVFWFNVAENKSAAWGVSPWWWYAANALPRGAGLAYAVAVVAVAVTVSVAVGRAVTAVGGSTPRYVSGGGGSGGGDGKTAAAPLLGGARWWTPLVLPRRVATAVAPFFVFVALYSALPHKELRFVFPVLPAVNVVAGVVLAAALGIDATPGGDGGSGGCTIPPPPAVPISLAAFAAAAATVAATALYAAAAAANYPGGEALATLQASPAADVASPATREVAVWICPAAAMTGVNLWGERSLQSRAGVTWRYSRDEGVSPVDGRGLKPYTHLIADVRHVPGYDLLFGVRGYAGVRLGGIGGGGGWIRTEEVLWVHVRHDVAPASVREKDGGGAEPGRAVVAPEGQALAL
ncbi:hypothetical protein MMPV_002332 [Pyropia vietnamensis]